MGSFLRTESEFRGLARFDMWDAKALPFLAKGMKTRCHCNLVRNTIADAPAR